MIPFPNYNDYDNYLLNAGGGIANLLPPIIEDTGTSGGGTIGGGSTTGTNTTILPILPITPATGTTMTTTAGTGAATGTAASSETVNTTIAAPALVDSITSFYDEYKMELTIGAIALAVIAIIRG